MLELTTLLLGLYTGVVGVDFVVSPDVVVVEARLDGELVAEVEPVEGAGRFEVDFGERLEPHELVAVGSNEDGVEVARSRQWVNLPRSTAEARLVFHGEADAPVRVTVNLESMTIERIGIAHLDATLDGVRLEVEGRPEIALPEVDPAAPHVLRVNVRLTNGEELELVRSFGGGGSGSVDTRLLPVRVELRDDLAVDGLADALSGCFATPPRARVHGVDGEDGGDVVFVRDLWALPDILRNLPVVPRSGMVPGTAARRIERLLPLGDGDRIRQMCPTASDRVGGDLDAKLFAHSDSYGADSRGVPWLLLQRCTIGEGGQRIADAVAVAGLNAYASGRPAIVVLVLGPRPGDESVQTPASVRAYLEDLHVPLVVWGTRQRAATLGWGRVEDVSSYGKLEGAVGRLRARLESQRLVWLSGVDLPQRVRLEEGCACCRALSGAGS